MENEDSVYVELQKHLDKQAIGFPATKSGVEIRILKELFDPEQASLALHLSYRPQSIREIFGIVKNSGLSLDKVMRMLDAMDSNGAIGSAEQDGTKYYYTIPLLVGIVEFHEYKATPQFWKDFGEYIGGEFGKAYAGTKVSQMRTIPVEKSIPVEYHVTTYDHIRRLINTTDGPIASLDCMCRKRANKRGEPCHVTSRSETCMSFGDWAKHNIKAGLGREVTRDEALEIIRQNEADGLVLQPSNNQKIDFLCSCCSCCCGIFKRQNLLPNPAEIWAHNFYSSVKTEICTGCGVCVERCQMSAITLDEQNGYAMIKLNRCIGCGNCVVTCPSEAIKLVKREEVTVPPEDRTSLYEILADKKA